MIEKFYGRETMGYAEAREDTNHSDMAHAVRAVREKFPDTKLTDAQIKEMIIKEYNLDRNIYG